MRATEVFVIAGLAASLAGCETLGPPGPAAPGSWWPTPTTSWTVQNPADVRYYPSDESVRLGLEHFKRGLYGLAASYFLEATERSPRDATAWLGLAASYDRLGRFDVADHAYDRAVALLGETPEILNDRGYSCMLRSDFACARNYLSRAYELAPNNPYVLNNLKLLAASDTSVKRNPFVPLVPFTP
jgi:Flp pilus assembly protein TadD